MSLGPEKIIIILVVALLVFGPNKLPQLGEALGKSLRDFKKAVNSVEGGAKAPDGDSATKPEASNVQR